MQHKSHVELAVVLLPLIELLQISTHFVGVGCLQSYRSVRSRFCWLYDRRGSPCVACLHDIFDAMLDTLRHYSGDEAHAPLKVPGLHPSPIIERNIC